MILKNIKYLLVSLSMVLLFTGCGLLNGEKEAFINDNYNLVGDLKLDIKDGNIIVSGKLRNVAKEDDATAMILFVMYDKDGGFQGTLMADTFDVIKSGSIWEFEASEPLDEDIEVSSVEIVEMVSNNSLKNSHTNSTAASVNDVDFKILKEPVIEEVDGKKFITGSVKNTTKENFETVEIGFEYFDVNGQTITTRMQYLMYFNHGETFNYRFNLFDSYGPTFGEVRTVKLSHLKIQERNSSKKDRSKDLTKSDIFKVDVEKVYETKGKYAKTVIVGKVKNLTPKDYEGIKLHFVAYDKEGNRLGTISSFGEDIASKEEIDIEIVSYDLVGVDKVKLVNISFPLSLDK